MARIPDDDLKNLHSLLLLGSANFITTTTDLAVVIATRPRIVSTSKGRQDGHMISGRKAMYYHPVLGQAKTGFSFDWMWVGMGGL